MEFLSSTDQRATLRDDIELIKSVPVAPGPDLVIGGFIFNVRTGELVPAVGAT